MKLEKLYKDIFEANVGDKLFADIDAAKTASMSKGFNKNFTKWVEQVYGPDYEPNTPEEEKLFWALGNYFGDAGKGKELGTMVDDLKALKSQFPNMLNPTSTTLPNEGYAYRGAKMPIAQYEKLIRKSVPDWGTFNQHARVDNPGITYKSRGQYGFTSFTTDYTQAEKFANSWKEGGDFVNVIYGVKLDNPNLVVNPSFANRMSEYPEDETLYVGNSITPDVIAIVDPRFIANVLYDIKAYEEENDLPEYSVRVKDFYPKWAKTHTPRLEDFNSDGTPKKKEDKKVRLDKKSPEEQAKIDKLKAMQAKKYGINERISLYEVYTDMLISEVGEGTSEPFEYVENFRKGDTFSYMIDAYTEQDDLERSIPIRLQAISFRERVSDDMEIDREAYFNFLDKPKGTIIDGYEIIFSIADAKSGSTFNLVNDKVYMFRLMATIKKILQSEFGSNPPDVLSYSPTKEGNEATEDTGRHKLYSIFIKKAFPNAEMFINDEDEEIYFKLK